eukprot:4912451-Karenia_brevis.AAC.1
MCEGPVRKNLLFGALPGQIEFRRGAPCPTSTCSGIFEEARQEDEWRRFAIPVLYDEDRQRTAGKGSIGGGR